MGKEMKEAVEVMERANKEMGERTDAIS